MRRAEFSLAMTVLMMLGLGLAVVADEAPPEQVQKIGINTSAKPREIREYKVNIAVNGTIPVPGQTQAMDVDSTFALKVRLNFGRREGDGNLPLEISVIEGEISTQGEKLAVTPALYPKITALLDRGWHIDEVFGLSPERLAQSVPGINYGNMVMLFFTEGGEIPHAIGEKWTSEVKFSSVGEVYKFTSEIRSLGEIDGVKVANVHQEITRTPREADTFKNVSADATADSSWALDNGRLIKSHAECRVTFASAGLPDSSENKPSPQQDTRRYRANTKIDLALIR